MRTDVNDCAEKQSRSAVFLPVPPTAFTSKKRLFCDRLKVLQPSCGTAQCSIRRLPGPYIWARLAAWWHRVTLHSQSHGTAFEGPPPAQMQLAGNPTQVQLHCAAIFPSASPICFRAQFMKSQWFQYLPWAPSNGNTPVPLPTPLTHLWAGFASLPSLLCPLVPLLQGFFSPAAARHNHFVHLTCKPTWLAHCLASLRSSTALVRSDFFSPHPTALPPHTQSSPRPGQPLPGWNLLPSSAPRGRASRRAPRLSGPGATAGGSREGERRAGGGWRRGRARGAGAQRAGASPGSRGGGGASRGQQPAALLPTAPPRRWRRPGPTRPAARAERVERRPRVPGLAAPLAPRRPSSQAQLIHARPDDGSPAPPPGAPQAAQAERRATDAPPTPVAAAQAACPFKAAAEISAERRPSAAMAARMKPCVVRRGDGREQHGLAASCLRELRDKGERRRFPERGPLKEPRAGANGTERFSARSWPRSGYRRGWAAHHLGAGGGWHHRGRRGLLPVPAIQHQVRGAGQGREVVREEHR